MTEKQLDKVVALVQRIIYATRDEMTDKQATPDDITAALNEKEEHNGIGFYINSGDAIPGDDFKLKDDPYISLKFAGIEINPCRKQVKMDYENEVFAIDWGKWLNAVEKVITGSKKSGHYKQEHFKLEQLKEKQVSVNEFVDTEARVKARILEDLLAKNVGFTN